MCLFFTKNKSGCESHHDGLMCFLFTRGNHDILDINDDLFMFMCAAGLRRSWTGSSWSVTTTPMKDSTLLLFRVHMKKPVDDLRYITVNPLKKT